MPGTCLETTIRVKDEDQPIEHQLVWLRWALIVSLAYMILIGRAGLVTRPLSLVYVGLLLASNLVIPRLPYRNPKTFGSVLADSLPELTKGASADVGTSLM